jgi:hypothetical protein
LQVSFGVIKPVSSGVEEDASARQHCNSEAVMVHPLIGQFQTQAEVLDAQDSKESIDDALSTLAAWIELARDHLSEDGMTVLVSVGGVLYREGLRKRLS